MQDRCKYYKEHRLVSTNIVSLLGHKVLWLIRALTIARICTDPNQRAHILETIFAVGQESFFGSVSISHCTQSSFCL